MKTKNANHTIHTKCHTPSNKMNEILKPMEFMSFQFHNIPCISYHLSYDMNMPNDLESNVNSHKLNR